MPHGQRDWSNIGADETVHGIADMAELAARLGSPVTFNREGNVLYMDALENGLTPWATTTAGTGAEVIVSNAWHKLGDYSCKLVCGSDGGQIAKIDRWFPYPVLTKAGLELSFTLDAYIDIINIIFMLFDGTNRYQFYVKYDVDNTKIQIRTPSGYVDVVTGLTLEVIGSGLFHVLKLVGDCNTKYYQRLIVNDTETDLTAYQAHSTADATSPSIQAWIEARGDAGQNAVMYVDDIIITQNEP